MEDRLRICSCCDHPYVYSPWSIEAENTQQVFTKSTFPNGFRPLEIRNGYILHKNDYITEEATRIIHFRFHETGKLNQEEVF